MSLYFKFIKCDGTEVTKSFNVVPVSYPIINGSSVVTGDPITATAPTTLSLIPNVFKVELNFRSTNDFFISGSSSVTASANIISGSYTTGSTCAVTFNLIDHVSNPESVKSVDIKPINENIGFNDSFVLEDSITKTTDTVGSFTVDLVPQTYSVVFNGTKKKTNFKILVPNDPTANAKDIIVTSNNVSSVITLKNQAEYGYTAAAADARFQRIGSDVTQSYCENAGTASLAETASYLTPENDYQVNTININGLTLSNVANELAINSNPFVNNTGIVYLATNATNATNAETASLAVNAETANSASYIAGANVDGAVSASLEADVAISLQSENDYSVHSLSVGATTDPSTSPNISIDVGASGASIGFPNAESGWGLNANTDGTLQFYNGNTFGNVVISPTGEVTASAFNGNLQGTADLAKGLSGTNNGTLTDTDTVGFISWVSNNPIQAPSFTGSLNGTATTASYLSGSGIVNRFTINTAASQTSSALIISQSLPISSSDFPAIDIYKIMRGSTSNIYTGIRFNLIDSGSSNVATFLDFQNNGTSVANIRKNGVISTAQYFAAGGSSAYYYGDHIQFNAGGGSNSYIAFDNNNYTRLHVSGSTRSLSFRPSGSTEVFFISGSGNVGIKTITPRSSLEVVGDIIGTGLKINSVGAEFGAETALKGVSTGPTLGVIAGTNSSHTIYSRNSSNNPIFYVSASGDSYFSGSVGIGTITPAVTLDVNGTISSSGSIKRCNVQTTNYAITTSDYFMVFSGSNVLSASLPSATTNNGRIYIIKNVSPYPLTVTGSQKIDNSTNGMILSQYDSMTIQSCGIQWWIQ